jgi:membrane-associated phospholipid phosphatase
MKRAAEDTITLAPTVIEDADAALAAKVEPFRETALVQAITVLSKLGDQPPLRMLSGATIAIGLMSGHPRLIRAGLRMIAAHTLATASKNVLKRRIDRTRPNARGSGDDHRVRPGTEASHNETSFPSGHSAGALAVGAAFARDFPEYRAGALMSAGSLALAQVPRGAHYLSDVAVGSALGLASEAALDRFARLVFRHGARLRSDHHQAGRLRQLGRVQEGARYVR